MGLERLAAVLQGKHDNYDIDLLRALILASAEATGAAPDGPQRGSATASSPTICAPSSFLIADGVLPSNEGRGYVLRRIMRRAMRHAHMLGSKEPLMHRLVPALVAQMGAAYPELVRAEALITETCKLEETRFQQTLERGLRLLDEETGRLGEAATLPGEVAFKLYDTYGFPLDLTQDVLRGRGPHGRQRRLRRGDGSASSAEARAAWAGLRRGGDRSASGSTCARSSAPPSSSATSTEVAEGKVLAIVRDGKPVDERRGRR